jgi:phage major head subunit gpT-like protein
MKSLREVQEARLERALHATLREASRVSGYSPEEIRAVWQHAAEGGNVSVRKLREANAATAFPQLLRAGVQQFMFDAYKQVAVVYPDIVRSVNSDKAEELYAPLYGAELPKEVKPGQGFEDSRLQGLDTRVRNTKFGRILGVERELVDDDQTGQIIQRASQMGERIRYVEEQAVMNALLAGTFNTTIGNTGSSGAQLGQPPLETATIALHKMKDPLGNLIMVQPDTLLVSPSDEFNAAKLLQSALQPSVPGAAGQTANTASSGGTGWTMTTNPLQGLYALKVSRFLPSSLDTVKGLDGTNGAWLLLQSKTSLVFQDRDPLEVMQENPQAGESFNHDVYRYRTRRRFASALIESRYVYRGN